MKESHVIPTLPLEIREHILRFTEDNFSIVLEGILGGTDIFNNYNSILGRLIKTIITEYEGYTISKTVLPCGTQHSNNNKPSFVKTSKGGNNDTGLIKHSNSDYHNYVIPRLNNYPSIEECKSSITEEHWTYFGKFHRLPPYDDYSSVKIYYSDGTLFSECWYKYGVVHREYTNDSLMIHKPGYISYFRDGSVEVEEWYVDGKAHRFGDTELPASIWRRYKSNIPHRERWYNHGTLYKECCPVLHNVNT